MIRDLLSILFTAAIMCVPFFPTGFWMRLEWLRLSQDELGTINANALSRTLDIFTPVFLGVAFIQADPKINTIDDASAVFMFLLWMAFALLVQRSPVALIEARKHRIKERGALLGHLTWIIAQVVFIYIFPLLVFWIEVPQSRMLGIVLFVDLVLQVYLVLCLYQKYRAA